MGDDVYLYGLDGFTTYLSPSTTSHMSIMSQQKAFFLNYIHTQGEVSQLTFFPVFFLGIFVLVLW